MTEPIFHPLPRQRIEAEAAVFSHLPPDFIRVFLDVSERLFYLLVVVGLFCFRQSLFVGLRALFSNLNKLISQSAIRGDVLVNIKHACIEVSHDKKAYDYRPGLHPSRVALLETLHHCVIPRLYFTQLCSQRSDSSVQPVAQPCQCLSYLRKRG